MKTWYASVNHGLEVFAAEILEDKNAENIRVMDSAVTFSCEGEINTPCINNLFLVLQSFHSDSVLNAVKMIPRIALNPSIMKGGSFRIVIMDSGKLRAIPYDVMADSERNISRRTGLSINRANPDTEVWLNRRNDGTTYFMVRINKHAAFDKTLKQGELRPDVAAVMLYKAKTGRRSVVADMFGGWGGIAAAVIESGLYDKIYAGDISSECVRYLKARFTGKRGCVVQKWDALALPLADMSVDSVITDPPWGEYERINAAPFYNAFIKEAGRVLRPGGSLVFLTSAQPYASQSLSDHGFIFTDSPIKINGRNAYLFSGVKQK